MPSYVTQEIIEQFAGEATDLAQEAARLLIKLERADAKELPAIMITLARGMHTLKGTSAAVGYDKAASLSHALESLLEPSKKAGTRPPQDHVDLVLAALDGLTAFAQGVSQGQQEGVEEPLVALTAAVRAAITAAASAPAPKLPVPSAPPPSAASAPVPEPKATAPISIPSVPRSGVYTTPSPSSLTPAPRPSPEAARKAGEAESLESGESYGTMRVQSGRVDAVLAGAEELHSLRTRLEARKREGEALAEAVTQAVRALGASGVHEEKLKESLRAVRRQASALSTALESDTQNAETLTQSLGDDIRALRTVPAASLLDGLERGVRDHARKEAKEVDVLLEGRGVEVDRVLLSELKGPMLHLLRNAVDHGLEAPSVRSARGKAARGAIAVRLSTAGEMLKLVVEDDGAGIDLEWVRRRAVELGRMTEAQAQAATDGVLEDLLFAPGFSTSSKVTETSGRGVGLDVVRDTVVRLRGSLKLESHAERGTRFTLLVPLLVTATHALMVRVRQHRFAIPSHAIKWIKVLEREHIKVVRGEANITDGLVLAPLDRLAAVTGLTGPAAVLPQRVPVVALSGARTAAFIVDDYDDEVDLIAKPLPKELRSLRVLAGVALLGNGESVLLLDPDALVQRASGRTGLPDPCAGTGRHTVMVVDDSATTRMLHQAALEAEGFRVVCASDGDEALRLLSTVACDVVVSDVRMPRMSGLALARAIRDNPKTRSLPVILCSSVEREELAGELEASGASQLLPKSAWERGTLAKTVRDALPGGGR